MLVYRERMTQQKAESEQLLKKQKNVILCKQLQWTHTIGGGFVGPQIAKSVYECESTGPKPRVCAGPLHLKLLLHRESLIY